MVQEEDCEDPALQLEVTMAEMQAHQQEAQESLEYLAKILEQALPDRTVIKRGGWMMSKSHPVEELTVKFEDFNYQILKTGQKTYSARAMKVVRGVVLKTSDIEFSECLEKIVSSVKALAGKSSEARRALSKFVVG